MRIFKFCFLFKIVLIPTECSFKIDADGNFNSLNGGCSSLSEYYGNLNIGISEDGILILATNLQSWKPIRFWKPILNLETSAGVSYSIQFSKSKNQFQNFGFVFNCFTSV